MRKYNEIGMRDTGWQRRPDLDDDKHMAWEIPRDRIARINQTTGEVIITEREPTCPS
jgi:hypothetical protein